MVDYSGTCYDERRTEKEGYVGPSPTEKKATARHLNKQRQFSTTRRAQEKSIESVVDSKAYVRHDC